MSKYTTELRFICETLAGLKESVGYSDTEHVIEQAAPIIFSFPFPVDDEAYRPILECKIIRHYYTREISEETYGLWKLRLEAKMNEIMPYYCKLYASERLEFNPLYDVDMTTTRDGENHSDTITTENSTDTTNITANDSTTTGETDTNNRTINRTESGTASDNKWDLYSDTPQGSLSNVANREYLTNARNNTDSASSNTTENTTDNASGTKNGRQEREGESNTTVNRESSGSGSIDSTDSYVLHVRGKQGGASYAKMIQEYRNALLNIDMMIINDLAPLFFNLW